MRVDEARQDDGIAQIVHRSGQFAAAERHDPAAGDAEPAIFDRPAAHRQQVPGPQRHFGRDVRGHGAVDATGSSTDRARARAGLISGVSSSNNS